ncbi:MAG: hypothetical protein KDK30_13220, partial [Leptospiraceae bacterium]|nr:hypothetical protein [Leptospiraceae bacterium]
WEHYDTEGALYLTIEYKPEPRRTFLLLEVKDYGNENGAYRRYYPDGSLEEEGYFWSGYFDGPVRRWHANGKPAMEGRYDQDNKTGTWKYYYPDGTLDHVEQYSNGKLNGVQRNYYPDGSPYHVSTFVDGQLSGPPEIFPLAR